MPYRSAVRRYCSKPIGTSRFSISFRKRGKFFITRSSLKCVTNVLEYPFLMLQLVTFKGGFSVSPCAMPKPLARFFLKIRITPGVWIWLPSSGKPWLRWETICWTWTRFKRYRDFPPVPIVSLEEGLSTLQRFFTPWVGGYPCTVYKSENTEKIHWSRNRRIGIPFESRLPAFPYGQRRMDQYRKPYVPGDSTERESNAGSKTAEWGSWNTVGRTESPDAHGVRKTGRPL